MNILIKNGRVIDPANNIDEILDIFVKGDKISRIGNNLENLREELEIDKTIDASNKWVTPGLIDLHVHLREPGYEYKETIKTGTRSAVMGGFTTICCMPNTKPITDSEIVVEYINMKAQREGVCKVLPLGAITVDQKGETLSDIGKMAKVGICAISEDGGTVANPALMKSGIKYASMFNIPVFSHCEELSLARGSMNVGDTAERLGLKGITNESESLIVSRDMILADCQGLPIHLCHISTKESLELIRDAKARGSKVTAEVTPHHFTLIDEDITDYDGNYKMNPPLRSRQDREAVLEALKNNTLEVIATDHAPHHVDEKNCEFEKSANGIVGLETAIALSISELVLKDVLTPLELIAKLTKNPAKILNREDIGSLKVGNTADVTIIDPEEVYKIDSSKFESLGKNTPFDSREVTGKVIYTIVNGKIVVENSEIIVENLN